MNFESWVTEFESLLNTISTNYYSPKSPTYNKVFFEFGFS